MEEAKGGGLIVRDPWDEPIVRPPANMEVTWRQEPVLWLPDGRVLIRRPAGFYTGAGEQSGSSILSIGGSAV